MTLEKLAIITQEGFKGMQEYTDTRFKGMQEYMDVRFNKVDDDINFIHGSLDVMRREIEEIKIKLDRVVYREELDKIRERVAALEKKLGTIGNR